MHIYVSTHTHIYIYICKHMYIYMHVHFIYIYIYALLKNLAIVEGDPDNPTTAIVLIYDIKSSSEGKVPVMDLKGM